MIRLRTITEADAEQLFDWLNSPEGLAGKLLTSKPVSMKDHRCWLKKRLHDSDTNIWIGECDGHPVGQVRLQKNDTENAEIFDVDIYVCAEERGKGHASAMLKEAARRLLQGSPAAQLRAKVLKSNTASVKLFETLLYTRTGEKDDHVVYMCAAGGTNNRIVPNRSFEKSMALYERALKTIPLATQTFSKSAMIFVPGASPLFLEKGDGCRVWDVDGQVYIDYILGLLPVVLGYRDPDVDQAIIDQLGRGISFSLATELEAEVAETLVRLIPSAEMVRFAKNGSDVTAAAVRLARAHTGRDLVAVCGYHGWHDWYIGTTTRDLGVPEAVKALTRTFAFNDADSLDSLLDSEPGKFAAIMLEPAGIHEPTAEFLDRVRELADSHGAVLVFDEMVTGFRCAIGGAQARYGVTPDLSCFGKAMGNGMPISAIVGRRDIMKIMETAFVSGTFNGEALSLASAKATLAKLERCDVAERIAATGGRLADGLSARIVRDGLHRCMSISGPDWWPRIIIKETDNASAGTVTRLMRQETAAAGLLIGSSFNLCLAHDDEDVIEDTMLRWDVSIQAIGAALADADPQRHLRGDPVQTLFKIRG